LYAESIYTDILIIGGGSAGSMAAIHAKELNPKQQVVVFEKADVKYSGSIPRGMDALNIVAIPGVSTPEGFVKSAYNSREGVVDDNVSYVIAKRSWNLLKKLENWGVYFPPGNENGYEALTTHSKGKYTVTMDEPNLKTILYEKLQESGCKIFNRTMAVELLVDNGKVVGAIGFNTRTGELLVCYAKAVILAGGGAARFGLPDNGFLYGIYDCPANSGDAYALAFKAGAELTGLECTVNYVIVKDINCPLLHITLTRGGKLINALEKELDLGKDSMIPALSVEHFKKMTGNIRIKLSHLPEEQIKIIENILFSTERPVLERFFEGRGINFRTKDIELGPTEYYLCGGHGITGVKINDKAESSIEGLYAAGDTAHAQGYLTGAFVLGELAVETATEAIATLEDVDFDASDCVEKINQKIKSWWNSNSNVSIDEFEYKVRRMINNYVTPPKNEFKLNRALEVMKQMRQEMKQIIKIDSVHDLVKAFEVDNIITCAILSAKAALERKESRWGWWHYRSDFPETDKFFEKHVVVKRGASDEDVLVYLKDPVRLVTEGGDL
jgi:succinate dehydrogenase/fumarate reductase flavoprotein subunit